MNGGGPFDLAPGQVTDDSEMAMCVLWGIRESNNQRQTEETRCIFDRDRVADYYSKWLRSPPFDIGIATR